MTDALDSPHNFIAEATAEFHFGHSDDDPGMTPDNVRVLGMSLDRAGVAHRNELFVGAAHGYTMQDTSAYSAEPAERHWKALEELLARAFVAHL